MQNLNTPADYWDFLAKNPHSIDRKIGILYAGRSGSMMLSGLLDGHDHLITMNCYSDVSLISLFYSIFAGKDEVPTKHFLIHFKNNVQAIFNLFFNHPRLDQEIIKSNQFDFNVFFNNALAICQNIGKANISFDMAINVAFIAYGQLFNAPLATTSPHIIIQIHVPPTGQNFDYYHNNLKKFSMITMARNVIKSVDSHLFHHMFERVVLPHRALYYILVNQHFTSYLTFSSPLYKDRGLCVYYEDIHRHPKQTMMGLCDCLSIPFQNILLQETLNNKPISMKSNGASVSGTSPERADNIKPKILTRLDIYKLEYIFENLIKKHGYEFYSNEWQRRIMGYFISPIQVKLYMWDLSKELKDKDIWVIMKRIANIFKDRYGLDESREVGDIKTLKPTTPPND